MLTADRGGVQVLQEDCPSDSVSLEVSEQGPVSLLIAVSTTGLKVGAGIPV